MVMKINVDEILYSFKYGKVITGKKMILLYIGMVVFSLMPIATICFLITATATEIEITKTIVWGLVGGNILSLLFLVIFVFLVVHYKRVLRYVMSCLDDAVKTEGYIERLDLKSPKYQAYQIQASFTINGKDYKINSTPISPVLGVPKYYERLAGKKVLLLYSKNFNEVLILK